MNFELNRIADIDVFLKIIEAACEKSEQMEICDRTLSLRNLYREAIAESKRLQSGVDEISSISAAVRNIFELLLIIKHLVSSDEAVNCWIGQLQQDALDIHEGLDSLFKKHGINSINLKASRENVLSHGIAYGVVPSKPFNIKLLAKNFGWEEDYDAIYKLCSKIVHPTSIRANLPGAFDKDDSYRNALIHIGIHYVAQIAESSKREFA